MSAATHEVSTTDMTVYYTDENGEVFDLNAHGEPCETMSDLRAFVATLHEQGAYDEDVRDRLMLETVSADADPSLYDDDETARSLTEEGAALVESLGLRVDVDAYGAAFATA